MYVQECRYNRSSLRYQGVLVRERRGEVVKTDHENQKDGGQINGNESEETSLE